MKENRKILVRLMAALLFSLLLLNTTPLTIMANGITEELNGNQIDIADLSARSGDGWEFDGIKTYTVTGDVCVIGENYDGGALVFDISGNHTVTWTAHYNGSTENPDDVLVEVRGDGTFIVDGGVIAIEAYCPGTALKTGDGIVVIIGGENFGSVMSGEEGFAIHAENDVTVRSGSVSASGDNCIAIKTKGNVLVEGGSVSASGEHSTAIMADENITIDDGEVEARDRYSVAIRSERDSEIVIIGESLVTARGVAIMAKNGSVTIGGESVVKVTDPLSFTDGQLFGNAVMAKDVYIKDTAKVMAINGAAIFYSGELNISGGAVFAYGDGIGGATFEITEDEAELDYMLNAIFKIQSFEIETDIEYIDDFDPTLSITGDGAVFVWDYMSWLDAVMEAGEMFLYDENDTTDIFVYPETGIDYGWGAMAKTGQSIEYSKGDNSGYLEINFLGCDGKPLKPNPKREPKPDPDPDPDPDPKPDPDPNPDPDPKPDPKPDPDPKPIPNPGDNTNPNDNNPGDNTSPGNDNNSGDNNESNNNNSDNNVNPGNGNTPGGNDNPGSSTPSESNNSGGNIDPASNNNSNGNAVPEENTTEENYVEAAVTDPESTQPVPTDPSAVHTPETNNAPNNNNLIWILSVTATVLLIAGASLWYVKRRCKAKKFND